MTQPKTSNLIGTCWQRLTLARPPQSKFTGKNLSVHWSRASSFMPFLDCTLALHCCPRCLQICLLNDPKQPAYHANLVWHPFVPRCLMPAACSCGRPVQARIRQQPVSKRRHLDNFMHFEPTACTVAPVLCPRGRLAASRSMPSSSIIMRQPGLSLPFRIRPNCQVTCQRLPIRSVIPFYIREVDGHV